MDDAAIVAALVDGQSAGLAEAYRRYADRLYTYCVSLLRDREGAADAVQDTFIIATERIGQLRDPDRFRPWLYAIARNECLRAIRDRGRSTALDEPHLEAVGGVTDETVEFGGLREAELRRLVWTAAGGLNPREREVLELSFRHELEGPELAAAIGVPPNHAHALLSKARQQLERALTALVVARTGRRDCATLDGLLADWDGAMSVLLRKRVARHIESCPSCTEHKRRDASATALLGMSPLLAAPIALRERVLDGFGNVDLVGQNAAIARRAGRFGNDGFPVPLDRPSSSFAWQAPAVAAAGAAVLLLSGVMLLGETTDTSADISVSSPPMPPSPGQSTLIPSPSTSSAEVPPTSSAPDPPTTATTEPEPPSDPPSSPPEPPPDLIDVHCGDIGSPCAETSMPKGHWRIIWLVTTSTTPIAVHISIPTGAGWLRSVPPQPSLVAGKPGLVELHISPNARETCGEMSTELTFAVDNGHTETFAVSCLEQVRR